MKGYMLVDMSMLMHRCMNKIDFLQTSTGVLTGLEFGSLRSLQSLKKKYPDHKIILCFDSPHDKKSIDSFYKSNRTPMDEITSKRISIFKRFLKCLYSYSEEEGLEADDILHNLSRICIMQDDVVSGTYKLAYHHYIYTNDNDLLQSVSEDVTVLKSFKSKLFPYNSVKVLEKYKVLPERLPLFRAFAGDKSDNLPGVEYIPKEKLAKFINSLKEPTVNNVMINKLDIFSKNMSEKIIDFIQSGQLNRNFKLMKLMVYVIIVNEPKNDKDYVSFMLKFWEISSLDICKDYVKIESEEF